MKIKSCGGTGNHPLEDLILAEADGYDGVDLWTTLDSPETTDGVVYRATIKRYSDLLYGFRFPHLVKWYKIKVDDKELLKVTGPTREHRFAPPVPLCNLPYNVLSIEFEYEEARDPVSPLFHVGFIRPAKRHELMQRGDVMENISEFIHS